MKNLLNAILLTIALVAVASTSNAQVVANCTPVDTFSNPGLYPTPDELPCITQGVWQQYVIYFKNYTATPPSLGSIPIDSVSIDTVGNLPCGFSWSSNKPRNVFGSGESGCIVVAGNTQDAVGQYTLKIIATAYFSGTHLQINAGTLGLRYDVRVIATGDSCPSIDTTAASKTASCAYTAYTGVNEVTNQVGSLSNYPNPFQGSTQIMFTALEAKPADFRVYNVLGQTVYNNSFQTVPGVNTINFDGNKLQAGVYFYSVRIDNKTYTNRMVINK
jgi:hypothetical protein